MEERQVGAQHHFPTTSPATPLTVGLVKVYDSFARISEDVVDARVWGGIHWRTSCVRGRTVGQQIVDYVVENALLPKPAR